MAGVSLNSLGDWERGKTSPEHRSVEAVVEALGLSMLEFYAGPMETAKLYESIPSYTVVRENDTDRPRDVHTVSVPYYESIPAGGWSDVAPERGEDKQVLRHLVDNGHLVVVRVIGMSMYPRIMDGDLVLVDTTRTRPRSGEVIVGLYQGQTTLKRFRVLNRQAVLMADNPDYPPLELTDPDDLVVLGVVTRIIDRDLTRSQM